MPETTQEAVSPTETTKEKKGEKDEAAAASSKTEEGDAPSETKAAEEEEKGKPVTGDTKETVVGDEDGRKPPAKDAPKDEDKSKDDKPKDGKLKDDDEKSKGTAAAEPDQPDGEPKEELPLKEKVTEKDTDKQPVEVTTEAPEKSKTTKAKKQPATKAGAKKKSSEKTNKKSQAATSERPRRKANLTNQSSSPTKPPPKSTPKRKRTPAKAKEEKKPKKPKTAPTDGPKVDGRTKNKGAAKRESYSVAFKAKMVRDFDAWEAEELTKGNKNPSVRQFVSVKNLGHKYENFLSKTSGWRSPKMRQRILSDSTIGDYQHMARMPDRSKNKSYYADMEEALLERLKDCRAKNLTVTTKTIRELAREELRRLTNNDEEKVNAFKASNGWVYNFLKRQERKAKEEKREKAMQKKVSKDSNEGEEGDATMEATTGDVETETQAESNEATEDTPKVAAEGTPNVEDVEDKESKKEEDKAETEIGAPKMALPEGKESTEKAETGTEAKISETFQTVQV